MTSALFTCAHCGNTTTASVLQRATYTDLLHSAKDPRDSMTMEFYYFMVRCNTCQDISLVMTSEYDDNPNDIGSADVYYPVQSKLPAGLPAAIAKELREAEKVERVSKPAYAVMIGRAMELLCKDKKAKGRTLQEQLDDLAAKQIIPAQLADAAHALRALRNFGAHATDYEIDASEVQAMKDFFNTLLEYVYVAPAKLATLRQSIARKTKKKETH